MFAVKGTAPFEAHVLAAEAHAASEQLDDLRTFLSADVEQSHRADAPAVPSFDELLCTDEDIDRAVRLVDVAEEAFGHDIFGFVDDAAVICLDEFFESVGIADVDEPKGFGAACGFQGDFALRASDIAQMQRATRACMEYLGEDAVVNGCRCFAVFPEIGESVGEDIGTVFIGESGIAAQDFLNGADCPPVFVLEDAVEETDDVKHIGTGFLFFGVDSVNLTSDECPQG